MNTTPRHETVASSPPSRLAHGVFLGFFFGLLLVLVFSLLAGGDQWSGERRVTNAENYAGAPAVGIDAQDNIYLVWEEGGGLFNESRMIHFMKMSPQGEVLSNRTLASAIALDSSWPDIAVEKDGTAHIVWQDSNPFHRNIFYMAISSDGENLFTNPVKIVQGSLGVYTPSVVVDEFGKVHIVWLDLRITSKGLDHEIYYTELDPSKAESRGGAVTDEDICLIDDTQISSNLMIMDIVSFFEFLTGYQVLEYPPFPDAAVDTDGNVHIVWTDARDGNPEIYYSVLDPSRTNEDGSSSDLSILSRVNNSRLTWQPSLSLQPMIALGPDDSVHLAFTDNTTESFEIYYGVIDQDISSINESLRQISKTDQEPSGLSPIFVDRQGNVYISWRDMCCDDFEIYLSKISSSGHILWDNQRISHSESTAGSPPTVVDSNLNPIIFWQDNRTSSYQIYYNRTEMFPDLAIVAGDITSDAMDSSESHLFITVHNKGNLDVLTKMDISAGDLAWSPNLHLVAGETKTYTYDWMVSQGDYVISVNLDPDNSLLEPNEDDNTAQTNIHVPYPPMVGIGRTQLAQGAELFEVAEANSFSLPLSIDVCWLNLSLYNSGGYPTGNITILIQGSHDTDEMDPLTYTTKVNMNASEEEEISFMLESIPGKWSYQLQMDSEHILQESWLDNPDLNFSIEFLPPPDPSIQDLRIIGKKFEGQTLTILVNVTNSGVLPASGTLSIMIDSKLIETRELYLPPGDVRSEQFTWKAVSGGHEISARLDLVPDSDAGNNTARYQVDIESDDGLNATPIIIAGVTVAGLVAILLVFTESGRYNFFKFMVVPLYTRLKRGKVLDHFMRGQVYGFIKANPGAHYNLIRRKLEINNGALAYHIAVLEREKFVRSRMDGTLKRFYPSDMNMPTGHELTEMERRLIEVLRANPGFSQKEIAFTLGFSPQVVNYHIKALARNHILRLTRVGKRTLCYLNEDIEFDS